MNKYELTEKYGREMTLYGKSLYWTSTRECPDTTGELKRNPDFVALDEEAKQKILEYGNICKRYGMGCYQQVGPNVELYDRYNLSGGVPNPFPMEKGENKISREEMENIAHKLAAEYGNEMRLYGMSLEWTSPRECPDTTGKLTSNPEFKKLDKEMQEKLLQYGTLCKRYGMGCYQENSPNAELYFKYYGNGGIPNPFKLTKKEKMQDSKPQGSKESGNSGQEKEQN